jgi:hypothetical protein
MASTVYISFGRRVWILPNAYDNERGQMRKRCLPTIGLVTWLMMMPPPKMPPVKDAHGYFEVDLTVPIRKWLTYATYRNEAACRGDLRRMPSYFVCVDALSSSLSKVPSAHSSANPRTSFPQ